MSRKRLSTPDDPAHPGAAFQASDAGGTEEGAAPEAALVLPSGAPDEHHGHGGEYQLVDGRRVLVQRTALA